MYIISHMLNKTAPSQAQRRIWINVLKRLIQRKRKRATRHIMMNRVR